MCNVGELGIQCGGSILLAVNLRGELLQKGGSFYKAYKPRLFLIIYFKHTDNSISNFTLQHLYILSLCPKGHVTDLRHLS